MKNVKEFCGDRGDVRWDREGDLAYFFYGLPSLSKIYEYVVFEQLSAYMEKIVYFTVINMDLDRVIQLNLLR